MFLNPSRIYNRFQVSVVKWQKTDERRQRLPLDEDGFTIFKNSDLLDLTTAKDDICNFTRVWIFSMYRYFTAYCFILHAII